ncbi:hypothetical protein [Congregibacter litoralis]|uniref:Uncharacterized protein n=1 Tax=Congregibacter litoralis KT71 TaxID=314285 RepID=A4ABV0_9GAMM|nr:hypothetical protein [Congregibacter litoralis]EAQ96613.1 hypothetical protein KT71_06297 [Congregibacter litoralis KT71]
MLRIFQQLVFLSVLGVAAVSAQEPRDRSSLEAAEGLWEYTDLITRDGKSLPLTGIFLIREGMFLQQSIFNGEPFAKQGSMAHAGPYWAGGAGLRLRSDQTLSLDPASDTPITSAGALEHDLKVSREGEALTLQFGGGTSTIQTFTLISEAEKTRIYNFSNGSLALADDYFILVIGDEDKAVTGYGTYSRNGELLAMSAIRWAESDGREVKNLRDHRLSATLSDAALTLADGRSFPIISNVPQ